MVDHAKFWEEQHQAESTRWLTGSPLKDYALHDNVAGLEGGGRRVMEIGVGLGFMVKRLWVWNNQVVAVDISPTALERVRQFCTHVCLVSHFDELAVAHGGVDTVICHLVLCHTDPDMTRHLLRNALRCLTPTGRASFHFATRMGALTPDFAAENALGVMFHYTAEEMRGMVEEVGGKSLRFRGLARMNETFGWDFVSFGRV